MPREHAREFANVDINQRATGLAASRPRPKPLQRQHHRSEYQDAAAIMQQPHHQRQWLMQQRLAAEQAGANVGFPAAKSFRNKARYEVEAATAKLMQEPLLRRVEDAPAAAATVSRQALQQAEERALAAEERAKAAKAAWEGAGRNVAAKVASSRALFAKLQGVATDIVAVATARKVARKATVLRALLVLLGVGAGAATLYFAATAMVPEPVVAPAQSNNPFKPAGGIAAIVAALGALFVPKYLAPLARSLNPTSRALVTSAAALLGK